MFGGVNAVWQMAAVLPYITFHNVVPQQVAEGWARLICYRSETIDQTIVSLARSGVKVVL
jgi:hypothetical protein